MPQGFAAAEAGRANPSTQAAASATSRTLFIRPCPVVPEAPAGRLPRQDRDQLAVVDGAITVRARDDRVLVRPGEREDVVAALRGAPVVARLVAVAEELDELLVGEQLEADVVGDAAAELRLGPEQPVR